MKAKSRVVRLLAYVVLISNTQLVNAAEDNLDGVMELAMEEGSINATGSSMVSADEQYRYTVNEDGTSITITKYLGTEENVIVPENLDGYTVTKLDNTPFGNNKYVKNITIPKTIYNMGVYDSCIAEGASNLQNIFVSKENPVYYDTDGILYKWVTIGISLCEFPEGKSMDTFKIPNNVADIGLGAFLYNQNVRRVIIPSTIKSVATHAFMFSKMEIYVCDNTSMSFGLTSFAKMLSGTKIIVTSSAMKDKLLNAITPAGDSNIEVINLAEADEETRVAYIIPSTELTFTDGLKEKSITIKPDTTYTLYDIYTQLPADTTESVAWTVSDPELATVNNAKQTIKINNLSGDFDLIGVDESGHQIVVHMKIYIPFTSCIIPYASTVSLGREGCFYLTFEPITAYAAAQVIYESSNPDVIEITNTELVKFGNAKEGKRVECYYKAKNIGTATITATINDNGNIITKTCDLVVDSDYYLPTHYELAYYYMNEDYLSVDNFSIAYTRNQIRLEPVVKNPIYNYSLMKTDYTVSYKNNINVGKATIIITGTGDYFGTITKDFMITPKPISECTISSIGSMTFTGKEIEPGVTVKNGSTTLAEGNDYTVTYANNKNAGTATVTIAGRGNYKGSINKSFAIVKTRAAQNISGTASYTKKSGDKVFSINAKTSGDGTLTYKSSNTKVVAVSDQGKVTIKGTGYAVITVTAKQTVSYEKATKSIKIYVVPKKETVTYLKSNEKSQMTIKWKKDTQASGYQIQYSTSSKFTAKSTKSISVSKNSTVSKSIKKLITGKRYYTRVRAYKSVKVDGKTIKKYGEWSSGKSVIVKK